MESGSIILLKPERSILKPAPKENTGERVRA
jgi:hypothetical protein